MKTKLPIPRGALDMGTILLGKTRSGKSSTCRVCVEALDEENQRYCILTPKDDWWGLKLGADGKSAGRSVVIFGGEYADIPINDHAGKHIGELVATGNRPCIITVADLSVKGRAQFFVDFAETLYKLNKGRLYLVIDECHNFAPKGKLFDPQMALMLHWANRLASEGLGRGITLISASQRPQKVHNDYLTSHETLIAKKVTHKSDRDADRDWIDGCGDPAVGRELIATVADLSRAEAWVWSPEVKFGPERVTFPFFSTYDSFKPQPLGGAKLKGWAAVDLDEVKEKLGAVVEKAKANDPAALKTALAAANAELAKLRKPASSTSRPVEAISTVSEAAALKDRERAFTAGKNEGFAEAYSVGWLEGEKAGFTRGVVAAHKEMDAALKNVAAVAYVACTPPKRIPKLAQSTLANAGSASLAPAARTVVRPPVPAQRAALAEGLSGPQQRIIASLGFWKSIGYDSPSREQVGGIAGYSSSSGSFRNTISSLNVSGLITMPQTGLLSLTEVAHYDPMTVEEARTKLQSIFGGPEKKIVDALLTESAMTREDLGVRVGYEPTSGSFRNTISALNVLGVIHKPSPGMVAVSDWAREVLT